MATSQMRWWFNINGLAVPNWSQLLEYGRRYRPAWTLIMDHKDRAKEWQREVGGNLIYRTYDSRDNYYHTEVKPIDAAIALERDHSDMRGMWHYYRGNEPGGDWHRLQDWLIAFAEEAKRRGFKVTSLGLALGKNWVAPDWVEAGHVDALIRYGAANPDTFLWDTHEYVTGPVWGPQIQSYPSVLFNRDALLAGEQIRADVETFIPASAFPNWGLFRTNWALNTRARNLGLPPQKYVITEAIFDWNAHIIEPPHDYSTLPNGTRIRTEDGLRRFGEDQFNKDIRGILGHRKYFEWLITGKENTPVTHDAYADFVIRNFQWAERNYPANCLAILLFSMNSNWRFPHGHDFSDSSIAPSLLPRMKALVPGQTPTPQPEPQPEPEPTPVPVPSGTIDLLPYMKGDGRIYDMQYTWSGGGVQRIQTQTEGVKFFQVKGHPRTLEFEWEELWHDGVYIYRGTDVSPSPEELYQVKRADGAYGERWMHRFAKVGDTLRSVPTITFRYKRDGSAVPGKAPYPFPHHIKLTAVYDKKVFKSGISLNDVIQLTGYLDANGQPGQAFEVYYYAKNYGLVAWQNPLGANMESYIAVDNVTSPALTRLRLPWLVLPPVTDNEPEPPSDTIGELNTLLIRANATGVRLRATPSRTGQIILSAVIMEFVEAKVSKKTWAADGFNWKYVEFRQGTVDYKGYVAEQYLEVQSLPAPEPTPPPLTEAEQQLVDAYRAGGKEAVLRLIVPENEQAILAAFRANNVKSLLQMIAARL